MTVLHSRFSVLAEPDMLADELFLLLEGARVTHRAWSERDLATGSLKSGSISAANILPSGSALQSAR